VPPCFLDFFLVGEFVEAAFIVMVLRGGEGERGGRYSLVDSKLLVILRVDRLKRKSLDLRANRLQPERFAPLF
jgi:hypothetical protein